MQQIGNFEHWKELVEGEEYEIPGERVRPVTLEVNSAAAVAVYVVDNDGEINFLARVVGRDKLRFVARGKASLRIEAIEARVLYIHTLAGAVIHLPESEKAKWSKYHERRAFNPAEELAKHIAAQNMRQMDAKLAKMQELADAINAKQANGGNGGNGGTTAESGAGADEEGGDDTTDDGSGK